MNTLKSTDDVERWWEVEPKRPGRDVDPRIPCLVAALLLDEPLTMRELARRLYERHDVALTRPQLGSALTRLRRWVAVDVAYAGVTAYYHLVDPDAASAWLKETEKTT